MPLPMTREKDLIIEELPGGELLVYDLTNHRAHNLNRSASLVWRHCDGETSFLAAAQALQRDLGLPADETIVRMAVERLAKAGLLRDVKPGAMPGTRVLRRDVVRRLALTGGLTLLLPVVMSIVAPTPAQAASCAGAGEPCGPAMPCCAGLTCLTPPATCG